MSQHRQEVHTNENSFLNSKENDVSYEMENNIPNLNKEAKQRKTVTDMLLQEAFSISELSKEFLIAKVLQSEILEEDRRQYLQSEIPRATIDHIDLGSSENLLKDSKTLYFFLGAHVIENIKGTLLLIVRSKQDLVHVVFLKREIVTVRKNRQGLYSFKFGPSHTEESAQNTEFGPSINTDVDKELVISTDSKKIQNSSSQFTEHHDVVEKTGVTGIPLPKKRKPLLNHSADHITNMSNADPMENNWNVEVCIENDIGAKNLEIIALKHEIKSLQIALTSTTRSVISAEDIRWKSRENILQQKIKAVRNECEQLRRTSRLLMDQNSILSNIKINVADGKNESISHYEYSFDQKRASADVQEEFMSHCLWNGCGKVMNGRASLWEHILTSHVNKIL